MLDTQYKAAVLKETQHKYCGVVSDTARLHRLIPKFIKLDSMLSGVLTKCQDKLRKYKGDDMWAVCTAQAALNRGISEELVLETLLDALLVSHKRYGDLRNQMHCENPSDMAQKFALLE